MTFLANGDHIPYAHLGLSIGNKIQLSEVPETGIVGTRVYFFRLERITKAS